MTIESSDFMIVNRLGLHARAAAQLVQTANRFSSDVTIVKDDNEVNGKSIMGLLALGAIHNTQLQVICRGVDAQTALVAVQEAFASGFGVE